MSLSRRPLPVRRALLVTVVAGALGLVVSLLISIEFLDNLPAVLALNSLGLFLLPALFAWPAVTGTRLLLRRPAQGAARLALQVCIGVALGVSCQPLVSWAAWLGERFMPGDPTTASSPSAVLAPIFEPPGARTTALALLLVAALPALAEELFFRGAMLTLLKRLSRSWTVAIVLSACAFSAAHFDAAGFLARLLMGVLLALLFVRSRSIWPAVAFHAVNNGATVLQVCLADEPPLDLLTAPAENPPLWLSAGSIALTLALLKALATTATNTPKP